MSHKFYLLSLVITILFVNIFAYQEDEYYCRNHAEFQICRRCLDLDNNCNVEGKGCFCDNIAILELDGTDFLGGANCLTINDYGNPYCYVNAASNCEKEHSKFARLTEELWYPKVDGVAKIYYSTEACEPENLRQTDTGNEEILPEIEINADYLVSDTTGEKIQFEFEPEFVEDADYYDYDYDVEPGYIKCQKQCAARNNETGVCGAWSFDALNAVCYLHTIDACCGQRDKQVPKTEFISGYACPHCWSTRNKCPCDDKILQTCATCTLHTTGGAAKKSKYTTLGNLLRVDGIDLNPDICECEQRYLKGKGKWECIKRCCKETGCQDTKRCRTIGCKEKQS